MTRETSNAFNVCELMRTLRPGQSVILEDTSKKAWHYADLFKVRIKTDTVYLIDDLASEPKITRATRVTVV